MVDTTVAQAGAVPFDDGFDAAVPTEEIKRSIRQSGIYSYYNLPPGVGYRNDEPSMTQQHLANDVDINVIMDKYLKTGVLPQRPGGYYDDATVYPDDYRQAMQDVLDAQEQFSSLPSRLRDRFDNDPAKLLDFLSDPTNRDEAIKIGLITPADPKPEPKPEPKVAPKSDDK